MDGAVYGKIEAPIGGFTTLEEELNLEGTHLWREGGSFAPFDQEVSFRIYAAVIFTHFDFFFLEFSRCTLQLA